MSFSIRRVSQFSFIAAVAAGLSLNCGGDDGPTGGDSDSDGDNVDDRLGEAVDSDDDGEFDEIDVDGDGSLDGVGVDIDGDGVADGVGIDTDGDGIFDGVDTDGDGVPDINVDTGGDGDTGGSTGTGGVIGGDGDGDGSGGSSAGSGGNGSTSQRRQCDETAPAALQLTEVASDLAAPIFLTSDPNDASKLYVVLRSGAIIRLGNDTPLTTFDVATEGELGAYSMAFHPDFGNGDNRVFVSYGAENFNNEIQAYTLEGDTMTPIGQPIYSSAQDRNNHNGGDLAFGPDGYLYLAIGDGGQQNDGAGNAQDLTNPMGAIVRIDVDNPSTPPAGNLPDENGNDTNIFHWGFRNPWRMSFDSLTGDLYVADVGQGAREEVTVLPAGSPGSDFGWPALEGTIECGACNNNKPPVSDEMLRPQYEHLHSDGHDSITGGYVYRGSKIPSLYGRYLVSDYGSNRVFTFTYDGTEGCDLFELTDDLDMNGNLLNGVASFGQDADGEVYIISINTGRIHRIDPE